MIGEVSGEPKRRLAWASQYLKLAAQNDLFSGFILLLWLVFQPVLVPACSYTAADLRGCML